MSAYAVTQKEWNDVMGAKPWKGDKLSREGDDYPATYISWNDCQKFVKILNAKEGHIRYYIPTEDEWEHACTAGTHIGFCGNEEEEALYLPYDDHDKRAKCNKKGQRKPNKWGLYDMHGNVWEWTATAIFRDRMIRAGLCDGKGGPDLRTSGIGLRIIMLESDKISDKKAMEIREMLTAVRDKYDLEILTKLFKKWWELRPKTESKEWTEKAIEIANEFDCDESYSFFRGLIEQSAGTSSKELDKVTEFILDLVNYHVYHFHHLIDLMVEYEKASGAKSLEKIREIQKFAHEYIRTYGDMLDPDGYEMLESIDYIRNHAESTTRSNSTS